MACNTHTTKPRTQPKSAEEIAADYDRLVRDGGRRILEIINEVLGADQPKPDEAACREIYARCFSAKNKLEHHVEFQAASRRVREAAKTLADALHGLAEFPEGSLLLDIDMYLDRVNELGGYPGPHFTPRKQDTRSKYHPLVRHIAELVRGALQEVGHETRLSPKERGSFTCDITDRILELFEVRDEGKSANKPSYTASVFRDRPRKSDDVPFETRFPNAARVRKL